MKGRVIITHGRSLQSLAAAKSLAQHDVDVIGCDDSPFMLLSFSRHVSKTFVLPKEDAGVDAYLSALLDKIKEFQPDDPETPYVLMPINWRTELFARSRERLEPHIRVAAPPIEAIERVQPKDRLIETARAHDIQIPPTWLIESEDDLRKATEEAEFPAFLKLADSAGGIGVTKVDNPDETFATYADYRERFELNAPVLLQEGKGEADYCATALARDGEVLAGMTYRNLRSFPSEGGIGALRETVADEPLRKVVADLVRATNWTGVAQFDFRWDGDANSPAWLIEVNPRFWGGLFQSIQSGVDYPWLAFQLYAGLEIDDPGEPEIGVRTRIPFTSNLSVLEEMFQDQSGLDEIKAAWLRAQDEFKAGGVSAAWNTLVERLRELTREREESFDFGAAIQELRDAEVEGMSLDDPLTGLGVLFILGSLIRHGRLPEELQRSGKRTELLD